jgi:CBS domain-containing protein
MKVAELMQASVRTLQPDATVAEAIVALADAHVSGLPVVDARGRLIGVLSSTDVLEAEAEAGDALSRSAVVDETLVSELMTPRPITITPDTPVQEAARQMLYADVKRLFVEDAGQLVGVLSQTDIVTAVAMGKV